MNHTYFLEATFATDLVETTFSPLINLTNAIFDPDNGDWGENGMEADNCIKNENPSASWEVNYASTSKYLYN